MQSSARAVSAPDSDTLSHEDAPAEHYGRTRWLTRRSWDRHGLQSDMEVMQQCADSSRSFGVAHELIVASAHRMPDKVHEWASRRGDRGIKVIVAAAGKAAHLGGVVAAFTPLPVITVPMKTCDLGGLDSLLSMVQMPSGVPVACVAINGAKNAAILATQMLGTSMPEHREAIVRIKQEMAEGY